MVALAAGGLGEGEGRPTLRRSMSARHACSSVTLSKLSCHTLLARAAPRGGDASGSTSPRRVEACCARPRGLPSEPLCEPVTRRARSSSAGRAFGAASWQPGRVAARSAHGAHGEVAAPSRGSSAGEVEASPKMAPSRWTLAAASEAKCSSSTVPLSSGMLRSVSSSTLTTAVPTTPAMARDCTGSSGVPVVCVGISR